MVASLAFDILWDLEQLVFSTDKFMSLPSPTWLKRVGLGAVDLLFPANCLACNVELKGATNRSNYCSDCRHEIGRGDWPVCRTCASRVPSIPGAVDECGNCRERKFAFDRVFALGDYEGLLREQILAMKTDRSERIAHALGQLMSERFADDLRRWRPDAIVSVPMHPRRRLSRGTNPPAALATTLGRELGLPTHTKLLCRRRNTQPQIGLSHAARIRNVRGEMQTRASYLLEAPHLVLIDDTLTTGATCSEASRVLKRAGAAQVTVLVAARTSSF